MTNATPSSMGPVRLVRSLFVGFLFALFIGFIGFALFRSTEAVTAQMAVEQTQEARQPAYAQTATAFGQPEQHQGAAFRPIAQFVTNTPQPSAPPDISPTPTVTPNATTPREVIPKPTFFLPADRAIERASGTEVPTRVPAIPREYELVNILLLGGDDELITDGTVRTDAMIIASINVDRGSVSLLHLPRDLFVYVPTPTMGRLNTVYNTGEAYGWAGGGFGLMREVIFYNLGIQVHYYVRANFSAFETIIDTLGGVEIAVDCTYQDWYPVEDFDITRPIEENYYMRTVPVGYYTMDGEFALWYARTRAVSDDFDRGRRQQQLLEAMFRQARDNGQIEQFTTLWEQFTDVVETNLTREVALRLVPLAANLDASAVRNYRIDRQQTIPWQPTEGPYAGSSVRLLNQAMLRPMLVNFYQPPTASQLQISGPSIAVYNGTTNDNWDLVASERLRESGLNAYAAGPAERRDYLETQVIDLAAISKDSPLPVILEQLNVSSQNVTIDPNVQRVSDYRVIIGSNYNSCPVTVLPAEPLDAQGNPLSP